VDRGPGERSVQGDDLEAIGGAQANREPGAAFLAPYRTVRSTATTLPTISTPLVRTIGS
jgi:hypothetical protein